MILLLLNNLNKLITILLWNYDRLLSTNSNTELKNYFLLKSIHTYNQIVTSRCLYMYVYKKNYYTGNRTQNNDFQNFYVCLYVCASKSQERLKQFECRFHDALELAPLKVWCLINFNRFVNKKLSKWVWRITTVSVLYAGVTTDKS